jgi:hypothetical protein
MGSSKTRELNVNKGSTRLMAQKLSLGQMNHLGKIQDILVKNQTDKL